MKLQLGDGRHTLSVGAPPAFVTLPAVHPLGQGQLSLDVELEHGLISRVSTSFGDGHRGDEKLLEVRDYRQGLSLINRHNWLTPVAAEIAYALACEDLMGLVPPPRAVLLRELLLALQNMTGLAQHLAGNSADPAAWLEPRERLVELTEAITGARLHVSFIRLGGVAHDVDADASERINHEIESLQWPELQLMDFGWSPANDEQFQAHHALLSNFAEQVSATLDHLNATPGAIDVTLPKVVRVPVGDSYKECRATTGTVGVWLHSDGGKSPLRVALTSPSLLALGTWQATSRGKSLENALGDLFAMPLCYGEIER